MSFDISRFNAAFQLGAGFSASSLSLFVCGSAFISLQIAIILCMLHWQKNMGSQKNPIAYLIPRFIFVGVLETVFIFVLFV